MTGEELPNHSEQAIIQELKNDYKGYSQTAYYNNQCQVHLLEKQDSGWFPREPRSYQVALVNSEEWYSKDKPKQFNSSSRSKDGVIVEDDSKDETSLEQLRRLHQANILVREELLATQREQLSYTEE